MTDDEVRATGHRNNFPSSYTAVSVLSSSLFFVRLDAISIFLHHIAIEL